MLMAGNPSRPQMIVLSMPLLPMLPKPKVGTKEKKLFGFKKLKKVNRSSLAFILVAGDILPTVTGLAMGLTSVATAMH